MLKRVLAFAMVAVLVFGLAACGGETKKDSPGAETGSGDKVTNKDWKIGILTGTVSQNEEEYRAAENVQKKYGEDRVTIMTYPDKFMDEQDTTIANIMSLASDEKIKAIVICQAVPGVAAGIKKAREIRDDLIFIAGTPGEDPGIISEAADIVMAADELSMGRVVMEQAKKLGAKTFVHYSFPRHMSYPTLSKRRDLLKETAEELGIEFVDATAPDPTGDAGQQGAQQFILEDAPKLITKYGKDTAFFATNCSMQFPLIKSVVEGGAIYPQPCCPSPFHGFPPALGIEVPDEHKHDKDYVIAEVTRIMKEKNMTGRTSTWPVAMNMMFVEAGAEYAIAYAKGAIGKETNMDRLKQELMNYSKGDLKITPYDLDGEKYENYLFILVDFVTF